MCAIFCASASAVSTTDSELSTTGNFAVVVPEVSVLKMELSASLISLDLTPELGAPSFGSKDLTISVGTSNKTGYSLSMTTTHNAESTTSLTRTSAIVNGAGLTVTPTIDSIATAFTAADFEADTTDATINRWGYKVNNTNLDTIDTTKYNAVSSGEMALNANTAPTNEEDTTIALASKIDVAQPAGTYEVTLNFTAVTNYVPAVITDLTYLQDFVALDATKFGEVLSSMTTGTSYTLKDKRDNEKYEIAKLADGNIWFLDNLRLDPTATALTSANTNVTSAPTATFTNKTSGWNGDAAYTSAWFNLDSKDIEVSYGSGKNKIGGYYNFCAASAGTYCMDSSSGSGNASQDLCPAGWRMPTGGNGGEYATLTQAITGTSGNLSGTDRTNFMNAAHIALSGYFWNASASSRGSYGNFWSSTFGYTSSMYDLYLDGSTVKPTNDSRRIYGSSIRCLVKLGSEMQKSTSATLAHKITNVNDVATLVDARDYQPYTVAKLADDKIWMTKNLNLPGGTVIESTKSDVPANYTLPTANGFQSGNKLPATETISSGTSLPSSAFSSDTTAYVFNSGSTTCASSSPCYSYYSWTTATAGSGINVTTNNTSALYSICPKGWKLPSTYNGTDSTAADYDFRALMIAYGGSSSVQTYNTSSNPTGATMYGKIGPTTTVPNFLLTGDYYGGSFNLGGSYGRYWSSTSNGSTSARSLYFDSANVRSADYYNRRYGFAIRCLLAN